MTTTITMPIKRIESSRAGRWIRSSALILSVFVLLVSILVLVICHNQAHAFVHPTRRPITTTPADHNLSYESILLKTEDGLEIDAWYIPSKNRAAIILQHGYPNNRSSMLPHADLFAQHGYGLILADLRAHGTSEGEITSFGLYEVYDVEAAYQYLRTRPEIDPERIGSLGDSMGGAVVLLHAAQNSGIKAVVSDSTYASLQDVIASGVENLAGLPAFPFAPIIQWFAEQKAGFTATSVAPVEYIHLISPRPIYLLHGGADELIPVENSQRLYEASSDPRELWIDPHLGHGKGHLVVDRAEEYEKRIIGFFNTYLLEK